MSQLSDSKKIISNQPNAESLNNQHSRKSSTVVRDIISAKSSKSSKQINQILGDAKESANKNDKTNEKEDQTDNLAEMQINVDLQPIELTKEEEQNHAEARMAKRGRDTALTENREVREISPDVLIAQQNGE